MSCNLSLIYCIWGSGTPIAWSSRNYSKYWINYSGNNLHRSSWMNANKFNSPFCLKILHFGYATLLLYLHPLSHQSQLPHKYYGNCYNYCKNWRFHPNSQQSWNPINWPAQFSNSPNHQSQTRLQAKWKRSVWELSRISTRGEEVALVILHLGCLK